MAELIAAGAALGVASSLISFIDVGWRVLKRIKEQKDGVKDAPEVFRHIIAQLPILIETMTDLKRRSDSGALSMGPHTALAVAVISCDEQINRLDAFIAKILPDATPSKRKRIKSAISSIHYEREATKAWKEIQNYQTSLTFHFTTKIGDIQAPQPTVANKPIFMVPFEKDLDFVGRSELITNLQQTLQKQSRVAISGIGGIGKSQVVIEYCYRFQVENPEAQVLWVHASNVARFEQSYRKIARRLLIPGWNDPNVNILELVCEWLTEDDTCKWLLVLDNADDSNIFFNSHNSTQDPQEVTGGSRAQYIPHNSKGSVILTTRDAKLGRELSNGQPAITVPYMTITEAKEMILRKIPEGTSQTDLDVLVTRLEYLPLAITQAAAFINTTSVSITKYLELLDADDTGTLSKMPNDLRRDTEASNSVIETWKISFDQINKQNVRAAEILSLMAVLDRQGLDSSLIRGADDNEFEFLLSLGVLRAFALITPEKDESSFEIHHLVQRATQSWLSHKELLYKWQKQALDLLASKFPLSIHYGTWSQCESLLPHTEVIFSYKYESIDLLTCSELLHNVGRYEIDQGIYNNAYEKIIRSIATQDENFGKEDLSSLRALNSLSIVLNQQGKYTEAEKVSMQVMMGRTRLLGMNDPATLRSMDNHACVLKSMGKFYDAEDWNQKALQRWFRLDGMSTSTLTSMDNLAGVYWKQFRLNDAEALNRLALEGWLSIYGPAHPDTLACMNNLATVLADRKKNTEAMKLSRQTLASREKILGLDHPDTLTTLNNLAMILWDTGEWAEAEDLQRRALVGLEKRLGLNHSFTESCLATLLEGLERRGKHDESEALLYRYMDLKDANIQGGLFTTP